MVDKPCFQDEGCILTAWEMRGVPLYKAKKPPNLAVDGFFGTAPEALAKAN